MKKILIVDDDQCLLKIYGFLFRTAGFEVECFECAEGLLKYMEADKCADLFILDMSLPDKSGIEILEQIKIRPAYCMTPIIINSGYSHFKDNFACWLADAHLVKNSDFEELENTVSEILGKKPGPIIKQQIGG